jgi:Holliday junction resolvasome RuvABC endonuclease subunit
MKQALRYRALTLAIHPTSRGFGWVAFEGPFSPYDWGVVSARGPQKNAICLRRIEKLLTRLTPETLVLEAFERRQSVRRDRIENLGRALVALAASHAVGVTVFSFGEVRQCFASVGAWTRQEIAEAVARQITAFAHVLPRQRKPWDAENRRMALFSAAALALTHYQRDAHALLAALKHP